MKTTTKAKILDFIEKNGKTRPTELASSFELSSQMVHRHLKALQNEGFIRKLGVAPLVFYELQAPIRKAHVFKSEGTEKFIQQYFSFLSPTGELLTGATGFVRWCDSTSQSHAVDALAEAFVVTRSKLLPNEGLINASEKFQNTFPKCALDQAYYADYWAIPQFGRTRLALLLTLGKSGQSVSAIKSIANIIKPTVEELIRRLKIDAVVFAPHSIPRKIQFLEHLARQLDLRCPIIRMKKVFPTGIPVAQKSLPKLQDRIDNAKTTLFLVDKVKSKSSHVLIIDDAVGSGATMNVIAEQLKSAGIQRATGFAIVGSLKGFEVIGEL